MNLNSYFCCKDTANPSRFQIISHIIAVLVATVPAICDIEGGTLPLRVVNTYTRCHTVVV